MPRRDKTEAERRCIASGETKPAAEMLRFVVAPDGRVVFDAAGKLPGRGLWLSARLDMLQTAAKKRLFAKAARAKAEVSETFVEDVAATLRARCLDRIGLARRAGELVQGFDKVRASAKAQRPGVMIEAADGGRDGREKIERLAPGVPVVALFAAEEIGRAIGRDNAVHALIAPGRMAEAFIRDAAKLAGVLDRPLAGGD
ncbi:MAG: RNA-binding protein [Alphaproteobacteria bacterium]|nr:RNA-binding protein [Alphaproteobacteria bacterium]